MRFRVLLQAALLMMSCSQGLRLLLGVTILQSMGLGNNGYHV